MTTRYDLLTVRSDKDGKARYTKIGAMFPSKQGEGFTLKFDALPLPNDKGEVWVSAFVPRPRDDEQSAPAPRQSPMARQGSAASLDDDIPFQAEVR